MAHCGCGVIQDERAVEHRYAALDRPRVDAAVATLAAAPTGRGGFEGDLAGSVTTGPSSGVVRRGVAEVAAVTEEVLPGS